MKNNRQWLLALLFIQILTMPAWAGSKLINVQGKITDNAGKLLSGTVTVTFRMYRNINDPIGSAVWVETQGFTATNSLFNVTLGNVTSLDTLPFNIPYYLGMQVSGDASELTPRQLLGASAYALGSLGDFNVKGNLVVNQNITATGSMTLGGQDVKGYLVPAGAIMIFSGSCPPGWTSFAPLNTGGPNGSGVFPMGGTAYNGTVSGSASHSHSITAVANHAHTGTTDDAYLFSRISVPGGGGPFNPNIMFMDDIGTRNYAKTGQRHTHTFTTAAAGAHDHGGVTGVTSSLPPYIIVVYCQKQ